MAVVTAPVAFTVTSWTSWTGAANAEASADAANGNKFENARGTMLFVRNTTAGAILVNFYADIYGTEVLLGAPSIQATGTNNGGKILGPFPSDVFNDHSGSVATANGSAVCKQASGIAGDLKFSPFLPPIGLAR